MKTKRFILVLILLSGSLTTYSQLNPVQNLQLTVFYGYPEYTLCPAYNCFDISWDTPETSTDTLIGYSLKKNNTFWRFTLQNDIGCKGYTPCEYGDIFDSLPCTIRVNAVYNHDSLESVAYDSVYIFGIAIGIENPVKDDFAILKNPVKPGERISMHMPYCSLKEYNIKIVSIEGQVVQEVKIKNRQEQVVNISPDKLKRGIYIIQLQMEEKLISKKVIIE